MPTRALPVESTAVLRQRPAGSRRTLVVCYSGGGHTRVLAREIAEQCGADFDEIRDRCGRRGLLGTLRSALEALLGLPTPICACRHDPANYDAVIIGAPVWCGRMASPVRSYLRQHRGEFRRVAVFCTAARSGQPQVLDAMARLAGCRATATLSLAAKEVALRRHWTAVAKFVRCVRLARRASPTPSGAAVAADSTAVSDAAHTL